MNDDAKKQAAQQRAKELEAKLRQQQSRLSEGNRQQAQQIEQQRAQQELLRQRREARQKKESEQKKHRTQAAVLLVTGLVIGYFIGREHLKYEVRSAMNDGLRSVQQGLANSLANIRTASDTSMPETAQNPQTPASTQLTPKNCIDIGDMGAKQLDKNDVFVETSWLVELTNKCAQDLPVRVIFKFTDDQDFVLEEDSTTTVIRANQRQVISDKALLSPPNKALQIDGYAVSVR